MPMDPTIALQYQPAQFGNALLQGQQLKGLRQQNQLRNLQIKAAQTEEAVSVLPQYLAGVKDQETYSMARDAFMAKYPGSVPLPEQYPGPEIMQRLVTWSANPKEAAKGLITKQLEMTKQANALEKLKQQHQNALALEKLKQRSPYTLGKGQQRYSGADNALLTQNLPQEQVSMYGQNALGRDITRDILPQHQEVFERAGWSQDKPLYKPQSEQKTLDRIRMESEARAAGAAVGKPPKEPKPGKPTETEKQVDLRLFSGLRKLTHDKDGKPREKVSASGIEALDKTARNYGKKIVAIEIPEYVTGTFDLERDIPGRTIHITTDIDQNINDITKEQILDVLITDYGMSEKKAKKQLGIK